MYIGIDLGTSSVKTLLVDIDGNVINSVTKSYSVINDKPYWSEQNPDDWFNNTILALKELTKFEKDIKGISFSGQMHGLVLLDNKDNILRNAILWNDQRTSNEVDELNAQLGEELIYSETNNIMLTGFTAPKVLWVKHNEPEIFKKINKIMLPKDYLIYKFTGNHVTDKSDISGSIFYDVKKGKYSKIILNYLEITENQLPKVHLSTDEIGFLNESLTKMFDWNKSPKIYTGGGDQAVGAVSTGTINDKDCMISLGTSGVVYVSIDDIDNFKGKEFHCFNDATGKYHAMGVTLSAAGSLEWYKQTLFPKISYYELLENVTSEIETEVIYLPYLSGERSPINNPFAKGVLFGLQKTTTRDQITKAILEGVGFSLKHILNNFKKLDINIETGKIIGGGSNNSQWVQILSDITELNIQTLNENDGAALGAAIIAIVGDNKSLSFEDVIKNTVKTKNSFSPNHSMKAYYDKKFDKYLKLYTQTLNLL